MKTMKTSPLVLALSLALSMSSPLLAQEMQCKIKNNVIVEKPVSPLLYGNQLEIGFGRPENIQAEMLYNRSFEEDQPYTCTWVERTKPQLELEHWWHSGYEQPAWYLEKDKSDTLSEAEKQRIYWPAGHGRTTLSVRNKSKTHHVFFAQDGVFVHKNQDYDFSGYFHNGSGFGADKISKHSKEITVGLYAEKKLRQAHRRKKNPRQRESVFEIHRHPSRGGFRGPRHFCDQGLAAEIGRF